MIPRLIAFTGLATSGKTTAAEHFCTRYHAHRLSFAAPIRRMLQELGLSTDDLTAKKELPHPLLGGKTPRHALQTLGTQWGRDLIHPRLWIAATEQRLVSAWRECPETRFVFDDCRFDNEARMIHEAGGTVVEITRPGLIRGTHESERGVSRELVDLSLENIGDARRLALNLDYLLARFQG